MDGDNAQKRTAHVWENAPPVSTVGDQFHHAPRPSPAARRPAKAGASVARGRAERMSALIAPALAAAAIPAVVLVGLAKGGFAGVGTLATPLLALVVSPVEAAAILLPILIVQDVVSVWVFRHDWDRGVLVATLPGAVVGIAVGYLFAARVTPAAVGLAVGLISILFALRQLTRHSSQRTARPPSAWRASLSGIGAGFTSQVAHAGAPPFQMYVIPLQLPRDVFVGTSAIFFATLNWLKVPAYLALGQFTVASLRTSAVLMPLAIVSTWLGVWLVRRVPAGAFYKIIYSLMILVGGRLIWSGVLHWRG